ncbi:hypothetical protein [Corynebacterium sputi]|uniref:hypothetical protein n=1 Tax=Corynebacterium sputi TaxID=489915 RepID=UPI00040A451F|nr:hypothetical protein [Corynebacterium sputi]
MSDYFDPHEDTRPITRSFATALGGIITLESTDVMRNCPTNLKNIEHNQRLGFTLDSGAFGPDVPAFEDPAALAAWMDGYFAGREHLRNLLIANGLLDTRQEV